MYPEDLYGQPDIIVVEDEWNGLITDGANMAAIICLTPVPKGR